MNLDQAFEYYLPIIETELRRFFEEIPVALQPFYGMMRYHMGWVDETFSRVTPKLGKRLRPFLCLLTCGAAGGETTDALPAAVALELVHNFSLVHDDIQDNSPVRRHRKTVWTIWGQPQAINVGDGLFAIAFLSLAGLKSDLSASRLNAIHESFARACLRLCEGQYMDMSFETRLRVSQDEYFQMIGRKTAALLSCAAYVGALIACDDAETIGRYQLFGEQIGLAFQIQDDILGIWGDPKVTGKPSADDIRQCKKTLPVLYALRREEKLGEHLLSDLYAQNSISEDDASVVLEALDRLEALDYVCNMNAFYCDKALEELEATDGEPADRAILEELVERLRGRPS